jgi:hypothetical protein
MTPCQEVPDSQSYRTRFNELDKTYSPSESANGSAPNGPAGQSSGEGRALPQVKGPLQGGPWTSGTDHQPVFPPLSLLVIPETPAKTGLDLFVLPGGISLYLSAPQKSRAPRVFASCAVFENGNHPPRNPSRNHPPMKRPAQRMHLLKRFFLIFTGSSNQRINHRVNTAILPYPKANTFFEVHFAMARPLSDSQTKSYILN